MLYDAVVLYQPSQILTRHARARRGHDDADESPSMTVGITASMTR
jgi:hypothetical protein